MRVPWTPDGSTWRDDEHHHCTAPAVVVIPPPLIHTSQSVGAMQHWLIDVFAPPRRRLLPAPGMGAQRRRVPDAVGDGSVTGAVVAVTVVELLVVLTE